MIFLDVNPRDTEQLGREHFEHLMQALQADVLAAAALLSRDAAVRIQYQQQIRAMSLELQAQVGRGALSWRQAAQEAQAARNAIMDIMRGRSSAVGRAWAQKMKERGLTLNALIAKATQELYGEAVSYASLSAAQKDAVYAEVVRKAGGGNNKVNWRMRVASQGARALIVLSIALSVYEIATAEDKVEAAQREGATIAAGIGGAMAGGAIAGLACGPAAPVCVTAGAFIGGALFALGASALW